MTGPRALDHLVMPTASLGVAGDRLGRLGFTVAPQGVHPFGTVNRCVYLDDGTFLEALAIGDPSAVAAAVEAGNSFVAGDRRFRAACGDEGLSALVLASDDAEGDARRYAERGIAGGPMVSFSRPSIDMSGKADTASFLLAFAAHRSAPDLHFFACERRRSPRIDRSALQRHANGARRIAAIDAVCAAPRDFAGFIATMAVSAVAERPDGTCEVALANCAVRIRADDGARAARLTGITLAVADLAETGALLRGNAIGCETRGGTLTVPAAAGQGAAVSFEETP